MASVVYLTDTRYAGESWRHPSARHRCFHNADALLAEGHQVVVAPLGECKSSLIDCAEHVVFHRPVYSRRFMRVIKICRRARVQIHADYDDLVFVPDYAAQSPLYLNGNRSLAQVEEVFANTYKAAMLFDRFITSTQFLKDKVEQHLPNKTVTVLPNSLPRLFQRPVSSAPLCNEAVIGYFPGSRGHGEDFNSIRTALSEVLGSQVKLIIVGRWNAELSQELQNVEHHDFADYNQYLELLSRVDVSIAPLTDSTFNNAKSAVKLIESVAVGTPVIASAIPDMKDHKNASATLVSDERSWQKSLAEIVANPKVFKQKAVECADVLAREYAVSSRLPILKAHFGWQN